MNKKFILLFPGQGSQAIQMGFDLYNNYSSVKQLFHQANDILSFDIMKIMFYGSEDDLKNTDITQPALLIASIAAFNVLKEELGEDFLQNILALAGHSLGEYSALCAASVLTFETTLDLVRKRGLAMAEACKDNNGQMLAILYSCQKDDIIEHINKAIIELNCTDLLTIANDNCLGQIVISGLKEKISEFIKYSQNNNGIKRMLLLPVSGAFHSKLMYSAENVMNKYINSTIFKDAKYDIFQNYNAQKAKNGQIIKKNLLPQITSQVKFHNITENIVSLLKLQRPNDNSTQLDSEIILELGSKNVLSNMIKKSNLSSIAIDDSKSISHLIEMLNTLS
jgi:[acyl-carrier-protein] S-malonyltransferase